MMISPARRADGYAKRQPGHDVPRTITRQRADQPNDAEKRDQRRNGEYKRERLGRFARLHPAHSAGTSPLVSTSRTRASSGARRLPSHR